MLPALYITTDLDPSVSSLDKEDEEIPAIVDCTCSHTDGGQQGGKYKPLPIHKLIYSGYVSARNFSVGFLIG